MKIVVFTAAFGETDTVRAPLVIDPSVEYLCFSDRPCVAPYQWIPVTPAAEPMRAARRIKVLADHPRLAKADLTLWHDASYRLLRRLSWVERGLRAADLLALRHPRRARIEDEALAIARWGYVTIPEAQALVAEYRRAGFMADVVTATGLLARRMSAAVRRFNQIWWQEIQRWGGRDQGSSDFAQWRAGLRTRHLLGTIRENRYAAWRPVVERLDEAVPA